ncbi:MAG: hypothetical protein L3J67_06100 [Hyphomicrobiaceae bacterium]|nr:hypothetical protein [Hyphomicrobiaceae bacterium]
MVDLKTGVGRKLLIVPPLLVGGLILGLVIASKKPPLQKAGGERQTLVRVITIEKMTVVPRVLGYGSVKPGRVWNAVAQVAGRVEYVHPDFKKGAIIKAGTEIIRISPKDYQIAIRQAQANIRSAQAKISELKVAHANTKASLAIEQKTLRINEREYQRKRNLASRGAVSKSSRDQEERLLLAQRKRVQDLQSALRLTPTQITAQKENKAVSQAQLEIAELNLKRTRVALPFDARIAQTNVERTQFVGVGKLLGIADSMKSAEVDAQIPVAKMRALLHVASETLTSKKREVIAQSVPTFASKYGLHGIVRMRLGGQLVEWPGKVVRISDTVDPKTRSIGAIIAVKNPYRQAIPGLRPPLIKGMFVEFEMRARSLGDQIVIPRSSLRKDRVLVVTKDSRLAFRKVTTKLV